MEEGFQNGFYITSAQTKKKEKKQEILKSKLQTLSSKPQPDSQATQNQLLLTPPRQPQKHQHATTSTENLPKKQKIRYFQTQTRTFDTQMDLGEANKEQILGMSREGMAKLLLALIEKLQEQEVHMIQLEKELK